MFNSQMALKNINDVAVAVARNFEDRQREIRGDMNVAKLGMAAEVMGDILGVPLDNAFYWVREAAAKGAPVISQFCWSFSSPGEQCGSKSGVYHVWLTITDTGFYALKAYNSVSGRSDYVGGLAEVHALDSKAKREIKVWFFGEGSK